MNDSELQQYLTPTGRIKTGYTKEILDKLRAINKLRCCRCKQILEKEKFTEKHFYNKEYPYCRECIHISNIASQRRRDIYKKFNITHQDYIDILNSQKNVCAICKSSETHKSHISKKTLHLTVDHCHNTGNIRGLLCRNCNLMLGNSKDSIKTLKAAIKYLTK